jgi:hypothetical protein
MALIVEDGTGKSDAESFISVADATTYHAARGNAAWAALASDTLREQALRKATDYMEEVYRLRWAGSRTTSVQSLSWPRAFVPVPDSPNYFAGYPGFIPDNVVPLAVAQACAELALFSTTGDLLAEQGQVIKRTKVDVLEVEYDQYSYQGRRFPAIDGRLRALFLNDGSKLIRR